MKALFVFLVAVCLSVLVLPFAGCEGGGSSSSDGDVVGMWSLTSSDGSNTWYINFEEGGNWQIYDDTEKTRLRVYGQYSVDGNEISGSMVNSGVGTGEISAEISGSDITLDFIEHWHTPYKHVMYTGSKL